MKLPSPLAQMWCKGEIGHHMSGRTAARENKDFFWHEDFGEDSTVLNGALSNPLTD